MYLYIVPAPAHIISASTHIVPAPTRIIPAPYAIYGLRIGVNRSSPAGCLTANFTTATVSADNIGK